MVSVEDERGGVTRDVRSVSRKSTNLKTARGLGRVYGLQLTRQHDSAYGLPWRKTQWAKNETMLAHFCQCDGPIHLSLTRFVLPLSAEWFCPVCLEVRGNMEVRTPNKRKTVISILYKLYNDILLFFFFYGFFKSSARRTIFPEGTLLEWIHIQPLCHMLTIALNIKYLSGRYVHQ